MATIDDITVALKDLTLTGVTPLYQELGRGAYGKVFTVKYREKIGVYYSAERNGTERNA